MYALARWVCLREEKLTGMGAHVLINGSNCVFVLDVTLER
jgi:hypothetical protein